VEYAEYLGKPVLYLEGCSEGEEPFDVVDEVIEEVLGLVQKYSDGSASWVIYGGVGAWEVLYGYGQNDQLFSWLQSLSDSVYYLFYQEFIRRWGVRYPAPIGPLVQGGV
jgi:hypothetical protein